MQVQNIEKKRVDMGEIVVTNKPVRLVTTVGSCIAACIYDSNKRYGGMAHIVLPQHRKENYQEFKGKFANIAIPALVVQMLSMGSSKNNLTAKIAGGSNMFPNIERNVLNIGQENTNAVLACLRSEGFYTISQDIGGVKGRKVEFDVTTGCMLIERLNGKRVEL
ncbi:chemotaxis protein CheD [archaeon]|nr:chemotaxis protein CheD [archaeon]